MGLFGGGGRRGRGGARQRRRRLSAEPDPILGGPRVVIERLDEDTRAVDTIDALGDLYAVVEDGGRFLVVVSDCSYADEAVVHLASRLDDIDRGWQAYLSWPRALDH